MAGLAWTEGAEEAEAAEKDIVSGEKMQDPRPRCLKENESNRGGSEKKRNDQLSITNLSIHQAGGWREEAGRGARGVFTQGARTPTPKTHSLGRNEERAATPAVHWGV